MIDSISGERDSRQVIRLNDLSARKFCSADELLAGKLVKEPLIARDISSVAGLDVELSDEDYATLAAEEVASLLQVGLIFEACLGVGFCYELVRTSGPGFASPDTEYQLHQIGEETRHSRLFVELLRQIKPEAGNDFDSRPARWLRGRFALWAARRPMFFQTLVLGGEQIPDIIQKQVAQHPDSDPHLAEVCAYHRAEEARHMVFARLSFGPLWNSTTRFDRLLVRYLTPLVLWSLWDALVHPGMYRAVGLPGWSTWNAVRQESGRVRLRQTATRATLRALKKEGVFEGKSVPRPWRSLCGVDRRGRPID